VTEEDLRTPSSSPPLHGGCSSNVRRWIVLIKYVYRDYLAYSSCSRGNVRSSMIEPSLPRDLPGGGPVGPGEFE
jgi:hypothetical protein